MRDAAPFSDLAEQRVFLYRLARALVHDEHAAEDLAQDALLRALEARPSALVSPRAWLARVLRRSALRSSRREGERSVRERKAARPESVEDRSERDLTIQHDVLEAVLALDPIYRSAIFLRFYEDRSPTRIAEELGVPVATVKTRLKRGLARLRQDLDRKYGGQRSAWCAPLALIAVPNGLGAQAAVTSSGAWALGFLMKKLVIAVCVLLLLGLGVWSVRDSLDKDAREADPLSKALPADTLASAEAKGRAVGAVRSAGEAPPAEDAATPGFDESSARLARIRGRCVRAEDGGPLAEALAVLGGFDSNPRRSAGTPRVEWQAPKPSTTDADGRFEVAFDPPAGFEFDIELRARGCVPRTGSWPSIEPGARIELGDIALASGYEVCGRVVDDRGEPVAEVGVALINLPLPLPEMKASDRRSGWSDAAGEFRVEAPIPAGMWSLDVQQPGLRLISPDRVHVVENAGCGPLLVMVRRMAKIEGIVVDDTAAPVERVVLGAEITGSGGTPATVTRKDGTFTLFAIEDEPKPVRIQIQDAARCEPPSELDPTLHAWGTSGLRFVLHRARTLELVVVERGSGAPVSEYAVQCWPERSGSSREQRLRLSGVHESGRVSVDRVWRGKNRLVVHPLDRELLESAELLVEVGDEEPPALRVEVERMARFGVRAMDARANPVEGAEIEVIEPGAGPLQEDSHVRDRFRSGSDGSSGSSFRFHELLSTTRTDALGRASVLAPAPGRTLALRARHPEHPSVRLLPVSFVEGQEILIRFPPAAAIEGRVLFTGLDPRRLRVRAKRNDLPEGSPTQREIEAAIEDDGRFALRGLEQGTYTLDLMYRVAFRDEAGGAHWDHVLALTIPPVVVGTSANPDVEIDATAHAPATLRGRVLLDGAPPDVSRLVLQLGPYTSFGQFLPDQHGAFVAEHLLPGTYAAYLLPGTYRGSGVERLRGETTLEIVAGGDLSLDLHFVHRRLVLRLLDRDGTTPLANRKIVWRGDGANGEATSDEAGVIAIDPAPTGRMHLYLRGTETSPLLEETLGPVEIPAGATQHEAIVTRPAERRR